MKYYYFVTTQLDGTLTGIKDNSVSVGTHPFEIIGKVNQTREAGKSLVSIDWFTEISSEEYDLFMKSNAGL